MDNEYKEEINKCLNKVIWEISNTVQNENEFTRLEKRVSELEKQVKKMREGLEDISHIILKKEYVSFNILATQTIDNIGEKIKYFRILKKMTQKELAKKTGLSTISVRKYESGSRKPKIETLINIYTVLEIKLEDLLDNSGQIQWK